MPLRCASGRGGRRKRLAPVALVALLPAAAGCASAPSPAEGRSGTPAAASAPAAAGAPAPGQVDALFRVLATGDQAAYERYVRESWSAAALAEHPAEDHADSLARIFAETGGFELERVVDERAGWLQVVARDRIVGGRYCVTIERDAEDAGGGIREVTARGLHAAGPELETPAPDEVARTLDTMAQRYAARDLFSGVILVAAEGEVVLEKAYGPASIAFDEPMTIDTRLNVASIGKMFTGVAIAQLVAAGKLSYEDTVGDVLSDYPDEDVRERATVRQLLAHTSGLGPRDYYEGPGWTARPHLRSVADYMELVAGTPLGGEPGKYLYSNSGYVILGAIVERLAGTSYYDYVRDHVFAPAGMTRSFYHEMDAEDPDVAVPLTNLFSRAENEYVYRLGRPRSAVYELAAKGGPQGGAYLTARDLLAFQRALVNGTLIGQEELGLMTEAESPAGAGAPGLTGVAREGLGVEVITRNGHTFFGHSGGDLGVASMLYWYPDSGYTTILLSNRDPRAARVLANVARALVTRRTLGTAVPPDQGCVPPEG